MTLKYLVATVWPDGVRTYHPDLMALGAALQYVTQRFAADTPDLGLSFDVFELRAHYDPPVAPPPAEADATPATQPTVLKFPNL